MKQINTLLDLKQEITLLEIKQVENHLALKEQFKITYESLRPINLIKNTFKDFMATPDFKGNLLNSTLGIGAGLLTKKVVIGATLNPVKQIIGAMLQLGVTNLISKNGDDIKLSLLKTMSTILGKNKKPVQDNETLD